MSNIPKLKKQAAEFEQKRQYDKALAKYVQVLRESEEAQEEADVALYNRVGDILLRQGAVAEAVGYYEKAVDYYADGGFFNNAIALCNKILRNAPGRSSIYYKLGKISAKKGFLGDAKQNFLEYADRMRRSGELDEAFRALTEFADLCPDQDDVRLLIADHLSRSDRKPEAVAQLQVLYQQLSAEGRVLAARATLDKLRAIDPTALPDGLDHSELVFLATSATSDTEPGPDADPAAESVGSIEIPELSAAEPGVEGLGANGDLSLGLLDPPVNAEPIEADDFPELTGEDAAQGDRLPAVATPTELDVADLPPPMPDRAVRQESEGSDAEVGARESRGLPRFSDLPLILPDDPIPRSGPTPHARSGALARLPEFEEPDRGAACLPGGRHGEERGRADGSLNEADAREPAQPSRHLGESGTWRAVRHTEVLRARVAEEPQNWQLRRSFGESLLEAGDRDGGLRELDLALGGLEAARDFSGARSIADEILRVTPDSVAHHQKRVEFAFRASDQPRLVEAYLELADCLLRDGQPDKARALYTRVLDLAPHDPRPRAALDSIGAAAVGRPTPMQSDGVSGVRDTNGARPPAKRFAEWGSSGGNGTTENSFVNLGDWLREDDQPRSTRMIAHGVADPVPGTRQADFTDMLERFKQGVAANIEDSDGQSHYDLGIAYREMGLLDEAIAEFQKALRAPGDRVRTYEALGRCFVDKGQFQIAASLLSRALADGSRGDDTLVGVLYLLGSAEQALGLSEEARAHFARVFAVDITFKDVRERLRTLECGAT